MNAYGCRLGKKIRGLEDERVLEVRSRMDDACGGMIRMNSCGILDDLDGCMTRIVDNGTSRYFL